VDDIADDTMDGPLGDNSISNSDSIVFDDVGDSDDNALDAVDDVDDIADNTMDCPLGDNSISNSDSNSVFDDVGDSDDNVVVLDDVGETIFEFSSVNCI
jgi:hypothetical protein